MQAILIKVLPATGSKGTRVKASCAAGSITIAYDFAMTVEDNTLLAAETLRDKLEWHEKYYGKLVLGTLPNGDYVAVGCRW